MDNQDFTTVTLSLDDGTECECTVIKIFPANDRYYIALLPNEGKEADEQIAYLYRYSETEDNEPVLENIESDEEYDIVSEAFDEELDAMEYEEMFGKEDETDDTEQND